MKSFLKFISEEVPFTKASERTHFGTTYHFKVGDDNYHAMIRQSGDRHLLDFARVVDHSSPGGTGQNHKYGVENNLRHQAKHVFSTMSNIIHQHFSENPHVKSMSFMGSVYEPSRTKLYDKLAGKYKMRKEVINGDPWYHIDRHEKR